MRLAATVAFSLQSKKALFASLLLFSIIVYFAIDFDSSSLEQEFVINRIRNNSQWIVNKNILQYSAYGILYENKLLKIEALVFLQYLTLQFYDPVLFRCVVSNAGYENVTIAKAVHVLEIVKPLSKIICEVPAEKYTLKDEIIVAIIYETDYDVRSVRSDSLKTLHYHHVRLFNGEKPKKQAISHCVHMLYGITSRDSIEMLKLTNWIDIQRTLGFEHIRFYVLSLHSSITDYLKEKYGSFVTFIQHPTDYHTLCGWHLEMIEKHPQSSLYKQLLHNCNLTFSKVFVELEMGSHDRTCMNDCYLNFKYEYELFANYDIDELILPRHSEMDNLTRFESIKCNSDSMADYTPKYSIYDYGIKLLNQFGRGKIACLMFKHVLMLPTDDSFMNELQNRIESNQTGSVAYTQDNRFVSLSLNLEDYPRGRDILQYNQLVKCLQVTQSNKIAKEFDRYFAIYFNTRWGKSISDTNLTETLNHHSCDTFTHGQKYDLDFKYGYASHFRSHLTGFLTGGDSYPLNSSAFDIEYALLAKSVYSHN